MKPQPIWVLVNCNSIKEAQEIGNKILNQRLASCFDIFRREQATYFWPPGSGKTENTKGALLIIETLEAKYKLIASQIKRLHSDQLPFIGHLPIQGVNKDYISWIKNEIK